VTVAQLCDHFEQRELAKDNAWRSHATKKIYKAYLTRWIIPHWRKYELAEVRTESWLRTLPLAKSSCAKIRNLMSVLFNHARRYELFDRNPICLVRQSAKRRTAPTILTPAEIKALLDVLDFRERALVFLAASTGLRQSELFGFEMETCGFRRRDHERDTLNRIRSSWPVQDRISQKPVPIHPLLSETLEQWRKLCRYNKPDDWIFASKYRRGRKPYWGQAILRATFGQRL
jgi:integrase